MCNFAPGLAVPIPTLFSFGLTTNVVSSMVVVPVTRRVESIVDEAWMKSPTVEEVGEIASAKGEKAQLLPAPEVTERAPETTESPEPVRSVM